MIKKFNGTWQEVNDFVSNFIQDNITGRFTIKITRGFDYNNNKCFWVEWKLN